MSETCHSLILRSSVNKNIQNFNILFSLQCNITVLATIKTGLQVTVVSILLVKHAAKFMNSVKINFVPQPRLLAIRGSLEVQGLIPDGVT